MNCALCGTPFKTPDVRMQTELRGICLNCAKETDFYGFTDHEINRCQAMLNVIAKEQNMTSAQRQHLKDMGR